MSSRREPTLIQVQIFESRDNTHEHSASLFSDHEVCSERITRQRVAIREEFWWYGSSAAYDPMILVVPIPSVSSKHQAYFLE